MNNLLNDVTSYLAAGGDLDSIAGNDGIAQVQEPTYVTDSRWFNYYEVVFAREVAVGVVTSGPAPMEYVGVTYAEGATEMQDADEEEPDVYAVVPKQVTQTVYKRV